MPALVKSRLGASAKARRRHDRVLLFAKEIEKTLTNLGAGHDARIKRDI
jgi:hypothetical protein